MDIDSLFAGMKEAPMFGRGNYMAEGVYEVDIAKLSLKPSFKGPIVLICEFIVKESSSPRHVVGSTGSWVSKIQGKAAASTFADAKCLALAAMSQVNADPEAQALAALLVTATCGSEGAKAELKALGVDKAEDLLIGKRVHLECLQVKTAPSVALPQGGDFTRYTWSPSRAS